MGARLSTPMMQANVSVVIPCFNNRDTIGRAVASVDRQTRRPAEVLIVDDCSTVNMDDVYRCLTETYGPSWLRVVWLERNGGPSAARNAGWDLATGTYVAFLDADDSWHPDKTEVQVGWMDARPEVAMTGITSEVIEANRAVPEAPLTRPYRASRVPKQSQLIRNRFATSSVVVRDRVSHRFDSRLRYSEDNLLWTQMILDGTAMYYLDGDPAVFYFKSKFGSTGLSGDAKKMLRGQLTSQRVLREEGQLTRVQQLSLSLWSMIKYVRRLLLIRLNKTS